MSKTQQIIVFKMIFAYLSVILTQIADYTIVRSMNATVKEMWQKIEGE